MAENPPELFIVSDNPLVGCGLMHSLEEHFGNYIRIRKFYNSRTCLRRLNENVQFVVLDHFIAGKSAVETSKAIKCLNPKAEIIMHSSSRQVIETILNHPGTPGG